MTVNLEQVAQLQVVIDSDLQGIEGARTTLTTHENEQGEVTSSWVGVWLGHELVATINDAQEWTTFKKFAALLSGPTAAEIEADFQEQQKAAQAFLDSGKAI